MAWTAVLPSVSAWVTSASQVASALPTAVSHAVWISMKRGLEVSVRPNSLNCAAAVATDLIACTSASACTDFRAGTWPEVAQ